MHWLEGHSAQFSSVSQSCLTLCDPMDCSILDFPVHHQPASVPPVNIQDWFLLGLTGLISLQSKGLSRIFSNTTVQKHQFFGVQLSLESDSHIHTWLLEKKKKNIALTRQTFVDKLMSLLFNMLSRLVIAFLPRSKHLLISWLQSHLQWFWSPER